MAVNCSIAQEIYAETLHDLETLSINLSSVKQ